VRKIAPFRVDHRPRILLLTGRELRSMADSTELNRSPWRQETVITATHASPTAPNDAAAVGQNDQRLTGSDPTGSVPCAVRGPADWQVSSRRGKSILSRV